MVTLPTESCSFVSTGERLRVDTDSSSLPRDARHVSLWTLFAAWSLVFGCHLASTDRALAATRPNVLVIITDDQRADCLGCAGHPHLKTPHIDRLAKEGVRFRNAFCTTSLCSPSRATILSGLYASRHGVTNNFTEYPVDLPSFPKSLQKAGYRTAYIGKWHMGEGNDLKRPGFDHFVTHKGQGKYFDTEFNFNGTSADDNSTRRVVPAITHTSSPTWPSTGSKSAPPTNRGC